MHIPIMQSKPLCRKLDKVKVKGKLEPCEIYEVIDTFENMQKQLDLYSAYRKYESALELMISGQKTRQKSFLKRS